MNWKRKVQGSTLAFIGFLLSPLSWWNDLFINVPLAVGFAWLVSLAYAPAFVPAAVVGYWLTNVLGFVLMHLGARKLVDDDDQPHSMKTLRRDVLISLVYTTLILLLIQCGVLKPVADYFTQP